MRKSCHLSPALLHWLEAESVSRIQRFKETLAEFPSGAPGAQVLMWATFIAAPDCVLPEHQAFFTKVLRQYYRRSGFENVLRGLEYLEGIWQRQLDLASATGKGVCHVGTEPETKMTCVALTEWNRTK
ncbi:hypothetical protein NW767_015261 [Fusarium falciforme]|nr:hypothetical protein NW767_015261 [Fusarium falciforme]